MIDWLRVRELQDEVGADDFEEVASLFLEEVDEVIERLEQSPKPNEYEADFHFLKGSALNLGFQAFADLCALEERRAAGNNHAKIDVGAAIECYQTSRREFVARQLSEKAA